jgi:hypothetical protein
MQYLTFSRAIIDAKYQLKEAPIVKSSYWQGIVTNDRPEMKTRELLNHSLQVVDANLTPSELIEHIQPDLPWADDHFAERVSRKALNPPPSESWWPHSPKGNDRFKNSQGIFSHTYPERYWPPPLVGIRYPYGNLDGVVRILKEDPYSRQAYLPVWYPEDLGAPIEARKPCTLGYHFIMRNHELHIVYYIRSCDFHRHFRNDIYMTVRLQHWVLDELRKQCGSWSEIVPGSFTMHITSLHLFINDYNTLFGVKEWIESLEKNSCLRSQD